MDPTGAARGAGALVLDAAGTRVVVRPDEGGRLGSVLVGGRELLVTADPRGLMYWGSYPMAPWAGRVRHGRFTFDGHERSLPISMPPHAIHGTVYDRPWSATGPDTITIELDDRWPFRGQVTQRFALDEDGLSVSMTLEADEPMPGVIGWHPWLRRELAPDTAPLRLQFSAGEMLRRDADGIPDGTRVPPPEPPWDDAFTGVREPPVLTWGDELRLELQSTCPWWVVYTYPEHALCVEPQSGPPDAVNLAPEVVRPGRALTHVMRWRWTSG